MDIALAKLNWTSFEVSYANITCVQHTNTSYGSNIALLLDGLIRHISIVIRLDEASQVKLGAFVASLESAMIKAGTFLPPLTRRDSHSGVRPARPTTSGKDGVFPHYGRRRRGRLPHRRRAC